MDQIGRITDDDATKATACYQAGAGPGPTQALDPLYAWNNKCKSETYNASLHLVDGNINSTCTAEDNPAPCCTGSGTGTCPDLSDHLQAGRDYYDETAKPGYVPYTYPHPLQGISRSAGLSGVIFRGGIFE